MTSNKAIAAHLTFNFGVRLSFQATEAKWRELTKDYRAPYTKWEDKAESIIHDFIEGEMEGELIEEFVTRLLADISMDFILTPIAMLKTTEPVINHAQLRGVVLEGLD